MKNAGREYWLVTWETLSKYGDSKATDVWDGDLVSLYKLLRKTNHGCVIAIIMAQLIDKEQYDKFQDPMG